MHLRVLAMLAVLGLTPIKGAVEGFLHVCRGKTQVRLALKGCCPRGPQQAEAQRRADAAPSDVLAHAGTSKPCCELRAAPPASPMPATGASERGWELPRLAALAPEPPRLALRPAEVREPLQWGRTPGLSRATAPPLYLSLRTLLL